MNNKVSSLQVAMLFTLLCCSMYLGLSDILLLKLSYNDTLIAMLIGTLIGLIPIFLYIKINNCYPDLNIYKKNIKLFGKVIGNILNILFFIICFVLLTISFKSIIIFLSSKYLQETPYYIIGLLVVLTVLVISSNKIETIGRLTQILFFLSIALVAIIEIFLIRYIEVDNIFPMLTGNYLKRMIKGSLSFASTTSSPVILLLSISKNEIANNKKYSRNIILFYLLAALSLTVVMFFLIACYGYDLSGMFRYPEYILLKKITISSSDLHIENLLAFRWLFYMITLTNMSVYAIKTGLKEIKLSNKIKFILLSIITIFSMYLSRNIFMNLTESILLFKNKYIIFVSLPIFIMLIVIFIRILFIKKKQLK